MENLFHFFSIFSRRDIGHGRFLHIDCCDDGRSLFWIEIIVFYIRIEGGSILGMHVGLGGVDDLGKINSSSKVFSCHVL
jgi:hypothetical protein